MLIKKKQIITLTLVLLTVFSLAGCGNTDKIVEQLQLGAICLESGDYKGAIAAYEDAIEMDKYSWEAYSGLLSSAYNAGASDAELEAIVGNALEAIDEKYAGSKVGEEDLDIVNQILHNAHMYLPSTSDVQIDIFTTAFDVLGKEYWNETYSYDAEPLADELSQSGRFQDAITILDLLIEADSNNSDAIVMKQYAEERLSVIKKYESSFLEIAKDIEEKDWNSLRTWTTNQTLLGALSDMGVDSYVFSEGEYRNKTVMVSGGTYFLGDDSSGIICCVGTSQEGTPYVVYYEGAMKGAFANGVGHIYVTIGETVFTDREVTVSEGRIQCSDSDKAQYFVEYDQQYVLAGPEASVINNHSVMGTYSSSLYNNAEQLENTFHDDGAVVSMIYFLMWDEISRYSYPSLHSYEVTSSNHANSVNGANGETSGATEGAAQSTAGTSSVPVELEGETIYGEGTMEFEFSFGN